MASPNMNLPIPTVGVTTGSQWATDNNSCFTLVDSHDHTLGNGVQITPTGLNINSDLTFANNSATNLLTAKFTSQTATLASTYTTSVYVAGGNLYYNNASGTAVQITSGSSVAGAGGTITGLVSPASAVFAAGVFTFQRTTNTPANIDGASFVFRNNAANSKGLTLNPPNSMAADYALYLPTIPASSGSFMTLDTSGNMSTTTVLPVNQLNNVPGISNSSGNFSTTSTSAVNVTNLLITITTTGRPVRVMLVPNSAGSPSEVSCDAGTMSVLFYRDSSQCIGSQYIGIGTSGGRVPTSSFSAVDPSPSPGSHTYTVQISKGVGGGTAYMTGAVLVVQEI